MELEAASAVLSGAAVAGKGVLHLLKMRNMWMNNAWLSKHMQTKIEAFEKVLSSVTEEQLDKND